MGNKRWNSLEAPESVLFPWDVKSTYIRCPSFFDKLVSTSELLQLFKFVTIEKKKVQCCEFFLLRPKSRLSSSLSTMPTSYCIWETLSPQITSHLLEVLLGAVLPLSTWQTEGMWGGCVCAWSQGHALPCSSVTKAFFKVLVLGPVTTDYLRDLIVSTFVFSKT